MQVCLRYTAEDSDLRNDMKISMQSFATERINRGGNRMQPLGIRMTAGIQLAVGQGELRLTSADPTVQPSPGLPLSGGRIRPPAAAGGHAAVRQVWPSTRRFKDIIAERLEPTDADLASDDALDAWLRREITTSQHISCTCKMGPASDPMAVVDQFGRVHGVSQSAGGGRLDHARLHPGQHQCDHHDDRRAGRGFHPARDVRRGEGRPCR